MKRNICIALVAMMLATSVVWAQPSPEEAGPPPAATPEVKKQIAKELGLTPEQEEKLKAQRKEFWQKGRKIRHELNIARRELKFQLEEPQIDQTKIAPLVTDIKRLSAQQLDLRVDRIVAMRKILTHEQFVKLEHRHKKHGRGRKKHMRRKMFKAAKEAGSM